MHPQALINTRGGYGTLKYRYFESPFRARKDGGMAVRGESALLVLPSPVCLRRLRSWRAKSLASLRATDNSFLHSTVKPFCSPHWRAVLQLARRRCVGYPAESKVISTRRRRYDHHDRPARRVCQRTVLKIDSKTSLEGREPRRSSWCSFERPRRSWW